MSSVGFQFERKALANNQAYMILAFIEKPAAYISALNGALRRNLVKSSACTQQAAAERSGRADSGIGGGSRNHRGGLRTSDTTTLRSARGACCGCLVVLMTGVCVAYGDFKKGGFEDAAQTEEEHQDEKVNVLCALAPLVPVALLLGFSFYIPSVKISVATAMLIGMMYAMLVTRADPQKTISKFFDGMGKGYGSILGIIIAAGVFASGLRATGVIDLFVNYLTHANEVAKIGGSVGPYVFGVLTGSGDAAAFAFNEAVTPHAAEFGMKIDGLGYLAMIAAGLGRMSSPLAGGLILLSGIAGVSPIEVVKRAAPAAIITLGILYFLV